MDRALREDSAFELLESASNLGVVLARDQTVLKDVAELDILAIDDSQELGGTWMDVWCVYAAWLQEAEGGGNAESSEDREAVDVLYTC